MSILVAAPRPPAELLLRGARVLDPRTGIDGPHDVLVRDGEIAAHRRARRALEAPTGTRDRRGGGQAPVRRRSSTRTSTCAPRARSTRRTSRPARAPPPPAATARSSRCRTPTPCSTSRRCCAACSTSPRRDARVPVGFMAAISVGLRGEQLTEMSELRDAGRARLHRRRPAGRLGRPAAPRAALPAPVRRGARAARGGPGALGRRRDARGDGLGRSSASRASRRSPSRR